MKIIVIIWLRQMSTIIICGIGIVGTYFKNFKKMGLKNDFKVC